ncbi:MAG: spore coat U domain-containing protein [Methylococcales bacterium]|nr:spore coat U domain-containing protein [Methylococcales bacterium]
MKTQTHTGRALRLAVASILAVGVGAISVNSYAGTNTANLNVTAEIQEACAVSTTAVAFSYYDPVNANLATALHTTGTVLTTCTLGATGTALLDQGQNGTGTLEAPVRFMKTGAGGPTELLGYQLYSEAEDTTVWGGTIATGKAIATGTGLQTSLTVYGTIAAGQNKSVGSYTDTVVVTIDFT